jgi:hypothetical protein
VRELLFHKYLPLFVTVGYPIQLQGGATIKFEHLFTAHIEIGRPIDFLNKMMFIGEGVRKPTKVEVTLYQIL